MKIVICFLAVVALAAAVQIEPFSTSSGLVAILEGVRDEMHCGFPFLGIGSLAPAFVSHERIDVDTPALKVVGSVQNFTVTGLNCFDILDLHHSAVRRKLTFNIKFNRIEVNTLYDLQSDFQKAGWTVNVVGGGNANFALKGLQVSGTTKYGISVISSKVTLKSLKIVPYLDGADSNIEGILGTGQVNKRWNEQMERSLPIFVNTFAEQIAGQIEAILLPKINAFLFQYTLNDIIGAIGGNEAVGEKPKCEPLEDLCS